MCGMWCNDRCGKLTTGLDNDSGSSGWWPGDMHRAWTTWYAGKWDTWVYAQKCNGRGVWSVAGDVSLRPGGGRTPLQGTRGRMGLWLQPCWASWLCPGLATGTRFWTGESEESRGGESGWYGVNQWMYHDRQTLGWAYGVYNMSTKAWWIKYWRVCV